MGIYLNSGNENYAETLRAPIYVDKTMMIAETARFIDQGLKNREACEGVICLVSKSAQAERMD